VSCGTRVLTRASQVFYYRAVTVFGRPFHAVRITFLVPYREPHDPERVASFGLGWSPFARHY
jgi:hypothetical protein